MIEIKSAPGDAILEINVTGKVTADDYKESLVPAIEQAIRERERIRILVRVDENFESYSLEAAAADAKLGLKHWSGFDRGAVVSDVGWIKGSVKAFSIFMPCPVQTFALGQEDEARRWLSESLGAIHQIDLGGGALHVKLLGQVDAAVYAEESQDLGAFIRENETFKLLLDLSEFDGWSGASAIAEHFKLVRDNRAAAKRVAIVGDKAWHAMAERIGRQFINAPVNYFNADDLDGAKAWLKAG